MIAVFDGSAFYSSLHLSVAFKADFVRPKQIGKRISASYPFLNKWKNVSVRRQTSILIAPIHTLLGKHLSD